RRSLGRAVDGDPSARPRRVLEPDDRALLRGADLAHGRLRRVEARPQHGELRLGMVGAHAVLERLGQLLRREVAHQRHRHALRAARREDLRRVAALFRQVQRTDVDLEHDALAQARAVQHQLASAEAHLVLDAHAGHLGRGGELKPGEAERDEEDSHAVRTYALSYSRVSTNSRCPSASAAVSRPFAVRNIISSSLSPAWSMLSSLRVMPVTSTSMCSDMVRTVRTLAHNLITGRIGLPMTLPWPVGKKCTT